MTPTQREATIKRVRAIWTGTTGLRTYARPWTKRVSDAELFDSEVPWNDAQRTAVARVIEMTEEATGIRIVTDERNTRMTVALSVPAITHTP